MHEDLLIHSLQRPCSLLAPLVILLPIKVLGDMQLGLQSCEAPQLQCLSAGVEPPNLVALNRPLGTNTATHLTPTSPQLLALAVSNFRYLQLKT